MLKKYTLILLVGFLIISSCRKEDDFLSDSSAKLGFSSDTIIFDTVFVTVGSTTRFLKVYNDNNKPVKISAIRLAGGSNSPYRLNVDGISGKSFTDVEIPKKDSIFIFIEVTVDPNNSLTPYIVTDSILFELNGNLQDVDLVAWGRNAHFFTPDHYTPGFPPYSLAASSCTTVVWDSLKPYVIYGYLVVDSCVTLIIQEGCKVYFYNNSGLWVFKDGTLKVTGTKDHRVTFQGSRLEPQYQETPGQWDRIWLNEGLGGDNEINYAVIKNNFIGIQAENFLSPLNSSNKKLKLNNTIIRNSSLIGLYAVDYKIDATNTVVSNCGFALTYLSAGGTYDFKHCTFANYWNESQRQTASLFLFDYILDQNSNPVINSNAQFAFGNCIMHGIIDDEFEYDFKGSTPVWTFTNCMLKTTKDISDVAHYISPFKNQDPKFVDSDNEDYRLDAGSFAIDKGDMNIAAAVPTDINGNPRTASPDLGAYEKQ